MSLTNTVLCSDAVKSMEMMENNEGGNTDLKDKGNRLSKREIVVREHKILVILIFLIIIAAVIGITLGFTLSAKVGKEVRDETIVDEFRLPRSVIPIHYVLEVQPYLIPDDFKFDGNVQILLTCIEETDKVIFHSNGLSFDTSDISLRRTQDGSNQKISGISYNYTNDFITLYLFENLEINNNYLLVIKYNGTMSMNVEGVGLYVSKYEDDKNTIQYIASTQFQPVHARETFPCFDEPDFKATFDIIIVRWRNMTSMSNMPKVKVERREDDWEADIYATSMKMSTYLVAFIVGKYIGKTEGKITIWTPKGIKGSVDFALDFAIKVLPFYENLLSIPYDAPKLDMAAVTQLTAAAMENWGLITYKERNLVLDTNSDYNEQEKSISLAVAHEMAHQWFGNLVTLEWWSYIWLNEGFTTYMQQIALKYFYPNWNEIDEPLLDASNDMFHVDCESTYPSTVWKNISNKKPKLFTSIFNSVAYNKGAIIVRMVRYILGNETFWGKLLPTYLKENVYGNVNENDFWRYVNEAQSQTKNARTDMMKMTTWTHLFGLPIVSVERNYPDNSATFSQQSCRAIDNTNESALWHIPISYTSKRNVEWNPPIIEWLSESNTTIFNMPKQDEWILVNGQSVGYYIVSYDKQNWKLLATQLKNNHKVFTPEQRYKIMADANNLYSLGYPDITPDILLDLSVYLHNEKVWDIFMKMKHSFLLSTLPLMKLNSLSEDMKDFIIYILGPLYEELGWNQTKYTDQYKEKGFITRNELIFWFCDSQYPPCTQEALRRFDTWKKLQNSTEINEEYEIREEALCVAARSENTSNSMFLYNLYLNTSSLSILRPLFCSFNSSIITGLLQRLRHSRNPAFLKAAYILADNEKHWTMTFDYIDENFEQYSNNQRTFDDMMALFETLSCTPVHLEKSLEITKKHLPNLKGRKEKGLKKWIEEMEKKLPKIKSQVYTIENWLKRKSWKM